MSAINIIQRVARKLLTQNQPKGVITIPNRMTAEAKAGEIAATLQRAGLSMDRFDDFITSETGLIRLLNQIEAFEKKNLADNIRSGIRNTESAKVFDLEGKEIPKGSKIMGGKEVKGTSDRDRVRNEMKEKYGFTDERLDEIENTPVDEEMADRLIAETDIPPGSRGGKDDIAAPVQSSEETLKNMIVAENKKNIAAMKQRKMLDDAIDNVSPSLTGDRKYDADVVAADLAERMGKVYDDMPIKERLDLYDQAYTALTKKKFDPPEDFAKGGIARIGLKDGMNRRTFLKLLGGAMSIPIIGKIFKPLKVGKTVTKVPIIKTDNVPGKPEWFDQLVNKVILEGDDVSKRFATKDREIVHMKVLDEGTGGKEFPPGSPGSDDISIMVTQDLDEGAVRVEYRNPENVYGDPVQLQYKKPKPDEGDPRPSAEFDTAESGPVGRAFGPDDYEIEIDELGGTSISDLTSDVSKLKEYATGKKPTLKEFVESKKRKDRAKAISEGGENEMDEVVRRQGEFEQFADLDPGDYASGGIARMLGE